MTGSKLDGPDRLAGWESLRPLSVKLVMKTNLLTHSLFIFAVVLGAGCRSGPTSCVAPQANLAAPSRDLQTQQLRRQLSRVTVADGISKSEAELIATCYFYQQVGCGGFTGVRDGGAFWIVEGAIGFAARPIQGFHIAKSDGKITSPIGPSYATPFEIFP